MFQTVVFVCCLRMEILPELPRNKCKMIPSVPPAHVPEPEEDRTPASVCGAHGLGQEAQWGQPRKTPRKKAEQTAGP